MSSLYDEMSSLHSKIIPVILKGGNYLLWSRTTRSALCSRGLWNHILKEEAPKETTTREGQEIVLVDEGKWFQEDQAVLVLLRNSLESSILEAYSYCETPKELWDTLFNVFGNLSNLSRVFEVKKAINDLSQGDMEFTQHFGKFRSLWAELEMLRPNTIDPAILNERREQDKVFGLLLTLNSTYNDLIKHLLRAEKLPNLEEVCSQIQKEQGSLGLFGNKGELATANKGELTTANKGSYKSENKRGPTCDHCKKTGHTKEKCWILHPHLRPSRWKDPKAHQANWSQETQEISGPGPSTQANGVGAAMTASSEYVKRSDLDALIKALKESSGNSYHAIAHSLKPLIVDSGASHHMISDSRLMNNIEPALGNVVIANGDKIPVKGIGDLELFDKKSKAFYMPNFTSNLLSVKRATTDLNCYAIFGPNDVHFQDIESSRVLGQGVTKDGLYVLEDTKLSEPLSSHFSSSIVVANSAIWHARLGHPYPRALSLMLPKVSFQNLDCEACILGKHCKAIFPKSSTIYESCFDLIHSDVWTSPCLSRENQKYFVTFIDEKSKYTWLTLLPSKDRVLEAFKNFHTYVTNQYNAKIKIFRSDNGGEYTSQAFKEHLASHGIIHQTSCPYTPQQNGVSERKNRHLMEVARSIMFHTNVPKSFWSDAVMTACYLINRTPTKILQDKSPFEVLTKTKPSLDHLRVFGCVCYVLVPGEQRNKLQAKSTKGMFIGYSTTQKGYKCYVPESRKVLVSRDVKFVEDKGFYDKKDWESLKDLSSSPSDRATNLRIILEKLGIENYQSSNTQAPLPPQGQETQEQEEESLEEEVQDTHNEENDFYNQEENHIPDGDGPNESNQEEDNTPQEVTQEVTQEVIPLRRSERLRFHPSTWKDKRVYYNANAIAHPIQAVCTLAHLPEEHQVYLSKVDQHWIPTTYEEAIQHKVWRDAIEAERQAMINNHTWDEEDLPRGRKAVTSKWVFTIKYKSDGEIERYKARLVARGFTQKYGEDYLDTFAPVAKLHTVRVVLSLATNLEWDLWQMDVKNAFLQGELEEEVYMRPPPGLEDKEAPGKVLKLNKAIYGLKQSPRAWYHKLSTTLLGRGFKRSEADHTLFTLPSQEGIVVILVYVDDIIISGNDKVGIQDTKDFLKSVFDIKDLGELKYFLGIEVCRSKEGLFLSQRKYTLDLLDEVGKLGAKPAKTPLEDDYKARRKGEHDNKPFEDPTKYRRLVGKLIYLTITRPDICFAVNVVSQQMQAPTQHHWNMVNRILKYLKGAPGQGIWMGCNKNTEIVGYCDADYAGDKNDRRSTTGYCTFIGGNLVTWRSKKQKVVSLSSAEAEYRAMRKLTTELMWLKALLKDFGIDTPQPITMHCDNQAAIHIATNSVFHERTKHIEVDCHKVREQIQLGVILPHYTESEEQLADIFTKGASTKVFNEVVEFGSKFNLCPSPVKLEGEYLELIWDIMDAKKRIDDSEPVRSPSKIDSDGSLSLRFSFRALHTSYRKLSYLSNGGGRAGAQKPPRVGLDQQARREVFVMHYNDLPEEEEDIFGDNIQDEEYVEPQLDENVLTLEQKVKLDELYKENPTLTRSDLAALIRLNLLSLRAALEGRELTFYEIREAHALEKVIYWVPPSELEGTCNSTFESYDFEDIHMPCIEDMTSSLHTPSLIDECYDLICESQRLDILRAENVSRDYHELCFDIEYHCALNVHDLEFKFSMPELSRSLLEESYLGVVLDIDKILHETENTEVDYMDGDVVLYEINGDEVDYFVKTSFKPEIDFIFPLDAFDSHSHPTIKEYFKVYAPIVVIVFDVYFISLPCPTLCYLADVFSYTDRRRTKGSLAQPFDSYD
ncbi:Integrase catalytic core [Arabidopsis thaliana x Arabidopsis arenosa]|uniref:Integrase catalytic core n=1 Tax=Arabidopsis thaliana x Arabidopsis arenosa TaxID=1240361 RepID=A0A8T1Z2C1_9BRAS|nr:Integrase catalytic core [Arabidopsis thaliana x Arabidopsis arenosa]